MIDRAQIGTVLDRDVYDNDGEKVGSVGEVFLDDTSGEPEWITVKTGLLGRTQNFVPLDHAELEDDRVVVPFSKEVIGDAPSVDLDEGHLDAHGEEELYQYYDRQRPTRESGRTEHVEVIEAERASGPGQHDRPEEHDVPQEPEERVLRRYVVTEYRTDGQGEST